VGLRAGDSLNLFVLGLRYLCVGHSLALRDTEISHVIQNKRRRVGSLRRLNVEEIGVFHIFQQKTRARIACANHHLEIADLNSRNVSEDQPVRRRGPKHSWFRVILFLLFQLNGRVFFRSTTGMLHQYIADLHIFDLVIGNSGDH